MQYFWQTMSQSRRLPRVRRQVLSSSGVSVSFQIEMASTILPLRSDPFLRQARPTTPFLRITIFLSPCRLWVMYQLGDNTSIRRCSQIRFLVSASSRTKNGILAQKFLELCSRNYYLSWEGSILMRSLRSATQKVRFISAAWIMYSPMVWCRFSSISVAAASLRSTESWFLTSSGPWFKLWRMLATWDMLQERMRQPTSTTTVTKIASIQLVITMSPNPTVEMIDAAQQRLYRYLALQVSSAIPYWPIQVKPTSTSLRAIRNVAKRCETRKFAKRSLKRANICFLKLLLMRTTSMTSFMRQKQMMLSTMEQQPKMATNWSRGKRMSSRMEMNTSTSRQNQKHVKY